MAWKFKLKRFWLRNQRKVKPSLGLVLFLGGIYTVIRTMPGWIIGVGVGGFITLLGLNLLKK
ncbi:hypothetical protein [Halonatronum saccharophilum]|uniref:hypothetical protein n=1 Tax=Halonatronum saccharophilum TaxID=150060 RepID=UPI000489C7E1|nr:hypothetical protein [Halonatronum saccharophilum]